MTPDALSRAICQYKEPVEALPNAAYHIRSPLEFYCSRRIKDGPWRWHHRDMVNNPTLTLMLLKELLAEGHYPRSVTATTTKYLNVAFEHEGNSLYVKYPIDQLGLAVAEAYARVKGILVE